MKKTRVTIMRKPAPGMTAFDAKTLSDTDAGEYSRVYIQDIQVAA